MKLIDADELEKEWTIASPEPYSTDAAEVLDSIRGAPTVDAVPVVHGRWTVKEGLIENAICSNCGRHFQAYYEEYHYCPRCGAKMDLEDENG